jgi:two-component system, sensor histidine kinase and response regulator
MLLAHTREGDRYVFDQPLRLLAVDDDPIMREFAVAQLSQPGCEIVTAEDGEAAWDILDGDARGFDLVLTDLEMPRLNGFGLLGQIRAGAKFAHLPVVVITTRDDVFAIDRAYELGATSFVSKPVNWRLLGHQLRYVMRTSRMEAEIRAARDEARGAADLRQSLLALLQHETRTPLHGIIGFAELLKNGADDPTTRASHADHVLGAARELNDKLRRVFYYAQLSTGGVTLEPEPAALVHVADQAVRAMRGPAAAANVTLAVETANEPAHAACDLRHLGAALQELLANAIAHSARGGRVEVTVARDGVFACASIRDGGQGIAPESLARCLEPFAQGADPMTRSLEGLGLGLPLARRIVELHGGRLELSSSPSEGTCARILLPLIVRQAAGPPAAAASEAA